MQLSKLQVLNESRPLKDQIRILDFTLRLLFAAMQGRVRYGDGDDGEQGENVSGEFQQFTTSATPDAENTIAHTLGITPVGRIIMWQDKAGSLYQGPTTGTNWDSSNVYFKCDVASVTFLVFLIK